MTEVSKRGGGSSKIIQQYNCYYLCVLKRKQCFITELSILLLNFQRTHSHTQMTGSGWVRVSLPSMFHCNQEGECFTHLFENQSARDGIENKVLWWCIEMTIILQTQDIVSLEKADLHFKGATGVDPIQRFVFLLLLQFFTLTSLHFILCCRWLCHNLFRERQTITFRSRSTTDRKSVV